MRYLVGCVLVLALGVMGCGQDLGPMGGAGGDGGSAGMGGGTGTGGGGGAAGAGGKAGAGGTGGAQGKTCFQDDECAGLLVCCHLGSPFEEGTCETSAVCDELHGGGGSGGIPTISSGLWTGGGLTGAGGTGGPGRPWSVCFTVNEASTALTADHFDCMGLAIVVDFDGCGTIRIRNDVPIVGGSFEVDALDNAVRGSFRNGTRAMGQFSADLRTCVELWSATPAD